MEIANFKKKHLNLCLQNFETASKKMPADFKSLHWDAFPNGYSDLIKNEEIWPRMLEMLSQLALMML